jgi:predicted dehydrogenase
MINRAIVVGAGSIGRRHLRNLKSFQVSKISVCDPDSANRELIAKELALTEVYADLESAQLKKGDVVFVCSPNHLHAKQALYAASRGCHLFVEKPLSHTMDGIEELCEIAARDRLITLVGCNMRFYPAIQTLKSLLDEKKIGRVLSFRVEAGIYLPNWRPHLDYRKNYGAHQSQGGGAILDMIHEIDYTRWLFGDPKSIQCAFTKASTLDIDTEDVAEINLIYPQMLGNVHVDYLSHRYTRSVHAIGDKGDLYWDWHRKGVELFDAATKQQTFHPIPENYDLNSMYLDEMKYFLEHVSSGKQTFFPVKEAGRVLQIALASKESSVRGVTVSLKETSLVAAEEKYVR